MDRKIKSFTYLLYFCFQCNDKPSRPIWNLSNFLRNDDDCCVKAVPSMDTRSLKHLTHQQLWVRKLWYQLSWFRILKIITFGFVLIFPSSLLTWTFQPWNNFLNFFIILNELSFILIIIWFKTKSLNWIKTNRTIGTHIQVSWSQSDHSIRSYDSSKRNCYILLFFQICLPNCLVLLCSILWNPRKFRQTI